MDSSRETRKNYQTYNPYQNHYDLSPTQKLYNLPTSPEFLFSEEAHRNRRSWSENLQYYTGTGYLSGALIGGVKGTFQGLGAAEAGETLKLRVNRVLNSGGHVGRRFGNNLGALGLMFGGIEAILQNYRDTDDLVNVAVAGLATGAVYRAANGVRSAAVAAAVGGVVAAAAVAGKQAVKRYVFI